MRAIEYFNDYYYIEDCHVMDILHEEHGIKVSASPIAGMKISEGNNYCITNCAVCYFTIEDDNSPVKLKNKNGPKRCYELQQRFGINGTNDCSNCFKQCIHKTFEEGTLKRLLLARKNNRREK